MKLITLNLWGGKVYEPLIEFIKKHKNNTDIFVFQEMLFGDSPQHTKIGKARENLFRELEKELTEFISYKYISPSNHFEHELINFKAGQAIFVRNDIKVKDQGGFCCYSNIPSDTTEGGKISGNLQWIDLEYLNKKITIANLHGLWQIGTKKVDTPERFIQSQKIKDFLNTKKNEHILCGDFNLIPNGKSIEILEQGMTNLIKKYNIQSTRSTFYKSELRFADYILISEGILVKDFKVFQDDVSDHLPIFLEFN